jgi:hypothetical protein
VLSGGRGRGGAPRGGARRAREPGNLRVVSELADCYEMSGRPAEALALLETPAGESESSPAIRERIEELRRRAGGAGGAGDRRSIGPGPGAS